MSLDSLPIIEVKMHQYVYVLALLLAPIATLMAAPVHSDQSASALASVSSPNDRLQVRVERDGDDGHVALTAEFSGKPVLLPSRVGVSVVGLDLGDGSKAGEAREYSVDESYPWRGVKSFARNRAHGLILPMRHVSTGVEWQLEIRAYDDGLAWRCGVSADGDSRVTGEATTFALPPDSICWSQPDTRGYQDDPWTSSRLNSLGDDKRSTPVGMPVTIKLPSGDFASLNEANVMGYSGMSLQLDEAGVYHAVFEDDPNGWTMNGSFHSPWRVMLVSKDLDGLVNADVMHNVCPPPDKTLFPEGINTSWIQPGRCLWQWLAYGAKGTEWSRQKWFVDRAAELNCAYYLVDEGWEQQELGWYEDDPDQVWVRVKELCEYANENGVGIWIWKSYSTQPKRQRMGIESPQSREDFFRRCKEAGVVGVKIDFMNSESHEMLDFYRDCLERTARHQLMVNFHGANKPAGESRTWPNEMTREAILGLEANRIDNVPDITREHYAALPFTRFVAGHGDFTPTSFRPRIRCDTTDSLQLATAVVFTSPILTWADIPDVYLNESPLVVDLLRNVPTVWDETRVLPGSEIGRLAIFARRSKNEWWLGLINGTDDVLDPEIQLDFLGDGEFLATTVSDSAGRLGEMSAKQSRVNGNESVRPKLLPGGGFVARLQPRPPSKQSVRVGVKSAPANSLGEEHPDEQPTKLTAAKLSELFNSNDSCGM
jgi:alpha-glucosidase